MHKSNYVPLVNRCPHGLSKFECGTCIEARKGAEEYLRRQQQKKESRVNNFSYEYTSGVDHYRIADADDNRVATCYQEENAALVTEGLSAIYELRAANEQIKVLERQKQFALGEAALHHERMMKAIDELTTEREVSDKLERALEFYANGSHSVYLYGVLVDWKAERSRLKASGFSCIGEGYNGGETYMEDGTTASAALAEVSALRCAAPAIRNEN